jgi:hypothetical protein
LIAIRTISGQQFIRGQMKSSFKIALKIYKHLAILFVIGFLVFVTIDDFEFWKRYWRTAWLMYIGIDSAYCLIFLLYGSLFYWGIVATTIWVYHKFIKQEKNTAS